MSVERSWRQVREDRLRADRVRMHELAAGSDLIHVQELEGDPPESYEVLFSCLGVVAPGSDGRPVLGEHHRVHLSLPIEYPTRAPQIRWLTEIFHPNINAEGTAVCIDTWYAGRLLDDLCVMLGRMIQYKNFNPHDCFRVEAARWSRDNARLLPVDDRPLRRGEAWEAGERRFEVRIL